ncbi:hypothetical protein B0J11DRAFT_116105 [Dendryphion nanum]|uniref:Uncharacterized protein n=1 Tax=Dendryphion nanum TaxID=256645 RepID=A0A9P9DB79_9PLEO|nr:hypothetical protein B0J11DRAFT_116105 [Dendryphion nanum]
MPTTPPPTPNYARPTAASVARNIEPSTSSPAPKTYKSITPRQLAQIMRCPAATIKPQDPQKPCPISTIPAEIRELIYNYILPDHWVFLRGCRLFPSEILNVCRVTRYETGYLMCSRRPGSIHIWDLEFQPLMSFLRVVAGDQRRALAGNERITLRMQFPRYIYQDNRLLRSECLRYGEINAQKGTLHKRHFVYCVRLADWFSYCGRSGRNSIRWKYSFELEDVYSFSIHTKSEFLRDGLGAFMLPCVRGIKIDKRQKSIMKPEALNMLNQLDDCTMESYGKKRSESDQADWKKRVTRLQKFLEDW